MPKTYNFANIRTLLIEGFVDVELRAFCFDSPHFRPVYHQLTQHTDKTEIVQKLLAYAEQKVLLDQLLAWAKEQNPVRYKIHQPYTNLKIETSLVSESTSANLSFYPLRIFLCHASGDKPAVRRLYHRLLTDGFEPWLDEENLIPGQKWALEIPKAVRSADVIIICLSHKSFASNGFVRDEIGLALEVAGQQPEGTIFLIPLRLEECPVPEELGQLHWVNYFKKQGYQHLLRALKIRAQAKYRPVEQPSPEISEIEEVDHLAPKQVEIEPPLIEQIEKPGISGVEKVEALAPKQIELKPPPIRQTETGPEIPPTREPLPKRKWNFPYNSTLWVFGVIGVILIVIWLFYTLYTPSNVRIAFESSEGLYWNIYVLESNKLNRKTTGLATNVDPTWSPAGSKLAFASDRNGNMDIYTQDADGKETALTTHPASDIEPAYSLPFGSKLAFASDRSGNWDIYTLDPNRKVEQMTRDPASDREPTFSPNGSKLAFVSDRDGDWEIYTLDPNREVEQMTRDPASDREPAFSPDGTKLAFASNRHGN